MQKLVSAENFLAKRAYKSPGKTGVFLIPHPEHCFYIWDFCSFPAVTSDFHPDRSSLSCPDSVGNYHIVQAIEHNSHYYSGRNIIAGMLLDKCRGQNDQYRPDPGESQNPLALLQPF